jgi:DNA helicase-2/ATP-dependent DNA helicase PcrA
MTAYANEDEEAHGIARSIADAGHHAIRRGEIAVLARTHQHCARIERALSAAGIEVRSRGFRGDSSGRRALDEARRISSPSALRSWAHDILDDNAGAPGGDDPKPTETVSSRQVAAVALEHLREQPDGTGATFASWMTTADPFGFQQGGGVEVLTFHAAKGREWERVWIAAAETGSVPHRSARTKEETLEEARLLYVAITRSTSRCHLSWAERRNGYRRSVTPFLAQLDLVEPAITGPSAELSDAMHISAASTSRDALRRLAEWREMTAVRSGILPEEICNDRVMRRIAEEQPADAERLNEITGWGDLTCTRLFPSLQTALVD